jgi:hypothetical protein
VCALAAGVAAARSCVAKRYGSCLDAIVSAWRRRTLACRPWRERKGYQSDARLSREAAARWSVRALMSVQRVEVVRPGQGRV